ncbi:uncharacterized protein EDB91DRAFT_1045321 [Suillus paluster]|uniref:uncharacterized protein n=1 Tax=Suillus paluster TaxID=48578 RepID=UPI001B873957|nr:uncharacterized protein EDB91DRAFT_1045321 [Suillus paluster]KAG1751521.1 hypothetical protein EDB91DRAFT_1045321 [Suillus paluster]
MIRETTANPDTSSMGDALAERACIKLSGILYPGDAPDDVGLLATDRFYLYQVSENEYVIMDSGCRLDPELTIPIASLMNPLFELDHWYWHHLGLRRGCNKRDLTRSERQHTWRSRSVGDALAEHATFLLDSWSQYPNDGPACRALRRFECCFVGEGLYEVYDTVLSFSATVSEKLLMNRHFNITNWYAKRLTAGYHALQDKFDEWTCEWDVFRLLDCGLLSPMDCQLDKLARYILEPIPPM